MGGDEPHGATRFEVGGRHLWSRTDVLTHADAWPGKSTSCAPRDRFLTPRHFAPWMRSLGMNTSRRAGKNEPPPARRRAGVARSGAGEISGLCSVAVAEGGLVRTSSLVDRHGSSSRLATRRARRSSSRFSAASTNSDARNRLPLWRLLSTACISPTLRPHHHRTRYSHFDMNGASQSHGQ